MKAKVVHIVTRLDFGGAQQNTLYTVGHLDATRFTPVLACGRGGLLDGNAEQLSESGRLRIRFFPDLLRPIHPWQDLKAFWQIYRFLVQEKPQIVHTHGSKAGILGRFAARMAKVPIVLHTFHGFAFHERQNSLVRTVYILLERIAALLTTRLIFVSESNQMIAQRYGIGDSRTYRLIRSGVKLLDYPVRIESKEKKKASLGARMHHPMLVSVGNLKPQKNAWDFLKISEQVLRDFPDARFVFIGDGPLRLELEAAILRKGLHGKVLLLGWRKDVGEILAAADIFLMTSLWEGLPRALIEAMKTGLPCACYATDGVVDVLKDNENGLLAPPGRWEILAALLVKLLQDAPLRQSLGARAAKSIGPEFDIDLMVRQQEALYDELLER